MKIRAAVADGTGKISISEVDLGEPGPGEVLVRLVATGICHTDVSVIRGNLPVPAPFVPGHEGAGVVEAIGPGVTDLAIGDHVICSISVSCGSCYTCVRGESLCEAAAGVAFAGGMMDGTTRLRDGATPVNHVFCQSSFAEYTIVPARSAAAIRRDAPLEKLASLGCSIGTGLGAAINRAKVTPGSTVMVMGAGGVGVAAMLGAQLMGAAKIIAVDLSPAKLARAQELADITAINPSDTDLTDAIDALTAGRGVDFAIDAVGADNTLEQCFRATRIGGMTVAVGAMYATIATTIDTFSLLMEKTLTGTYGGSLSPKRDIPAFVDLYMAGRLDIGAIVDRTFSLDEAPAAIDSLENGEYLRGVVLF